MSDELKSYIVEQLKSGSDWLQNSAINEYINIRITTCWVWIITFAVLIALFAFVIFFVFKKLYKKQLKKEQAYGGCYYYNNFFDYLTDNLLGMIVIVFGVFITIFGIVVFFACGYELIMWATNPNGMLLSNIIS